MTDDWLELIRALLDAHARFLVVGAHAMAVHGVPRGTQDIDLWIDNRPDNPDRVWSALAVFGAPLESMGVTRQDLERDDVVIQLGLPPNRIDILTTLTGLDDFDQTWADRTEQMMGELAVPFIGRRALITNKRATGRRKDLADLEALGELSPGE
jgi:hypothetical protein